ncbi:MAG: hypothetical protein IKM88_17245 [Lachnospiraceae bacterium]|nr:hypothetical protein [Clostridiales bacterium]MBR6851970.1 hypothetical protein [Lachnospiraceae bacterium]
MPVCKFCQQENPEGSQFCLRCGNNLQGAILAPATPSTNTTSTQSNGVKPAPAPIQPPVAPLPVPSNQGPHSQQFEQPNRIPYNDYDRQQYAQRMANAGRPDYEAVCVLAFVFGVLGFFFDPLYLISLAAIILGIIGHANNGTKKSLGMAGWILGICSCFFQIVMDYICMVSTCGVGAISIFF